MSKKRRNFISESKSKIIMEMLENGMSINEIASKHNLHPKTVQLWKNNLSRISLVVKNKKFKVKKRERGYKNCLYPI